MKNARKWNSILCSEYELELFVRNAKKIQFLKILNVEFLITKKDYIISLSMEKSELCDEKLIL